MMCLVSLSLPVRLGHNYDGESGTSYTWCYLDLTEKVEQAQAPEQARESVEW